MKKKDIKMNKRYMDVYNKTVRTGSQIIDDFRIESLESLRNEGYDIGSFECYTAHMFVMSGA